MLEKIDNAMYLIIWIIEDWKNYFSKNKKQSLVNFEVFKREIKSPEISEEGLKRKINNLRSFDMNLLFYGPILVISSIFINMLLFKMNVEAAILIAAILFYILGTAISFSFRVSVASIDLFIYKRLKRKDLLSSFKTSKMSIPKAWDLIPGVLISYFYYHFVIFIVYF